MPGALDGQEMMDELSALGLRHVGHDIRRMECRIMVVICSDHASRYHYRIYEKYTYIL